MLVDRFELSLHRAPTLAVRELTGEEGRRARALLLSRPEGNEHAVHEFRKSLKGLRALARLARQGLGSRFRACNHALRDAGRLLSDLRDQAALLEALAALRGAFEGPAERWAIDGAEQTLTSHQPEANGEFEARIPLALEAHARGTQLLEAVELRSYEDLSEGFRLSYRDARRQYRQLQVVRDDVTLHDLRKRIKDHRFHLELLASASASLAAERATADQVSELLGIDHDLVLLTDRLRTRELAPDLALALARLIAVRRVAQQDQALDLCKSLLEEKPRARTRRIFSLVGEARVRQEQM